VNLKKSTAYCYYAVAVACLFGCGECGDKLKLAPTNAREEKLASQSSEATEECSAPVNAQDSMVWPGHEATMVTAWGHDWVVVVAPRFPASEPLKFYVLGRERCQGKRLRAPDGLKVLDLATGANSSRLALAQGEEGGALLEHTGSGWKPLALLPEAISEVSASARLIADGDNVLIVDRSTLWFRQDSTWARMALPDDSQVAPIASDTLLLVGSRLYVGTQRGEYGGLLAAFDLDTSSNTAVLVKEASVLELALPVWAMVADAQGQIWAACGLAHLGRREGRVMKFRDDKWAVFAHSDSKSAPNSSWNLPPAAFVSVQLDHEGRPLVLGRGTGLAKFTGVGWRRIGTNWPDFHHVDDRLGGSIVFPNEPDRFVLIDQNTAILAAKARGAFLYDLKSGALTPIELLD
tara:strand:+ start:6505 stop:7722 length:1218 start_codon:yes stop_codon:yes gene_type:complete